ncbi:hypothetical protein BCV53_12590 [Parageobacillus thermoglucosidasius]|uniref:Uncharacterized protein n=1 Tax=Parageobacillus thermoglucosidasius TaxID=1426 RepID=A0AAN0YP79_PARTM|nr:hypothetical protein AOT13_12580 [Parageobacillus thermoglucosidasius]ANZ30863.1 hypothetical protein BCV53_12590 [Parageobacillus thermoglucosidasius]APM81600.1 hypothetical protein BCV54_12600 [Parageobacillus thermoglucosidasius]KJX67679.1 hypothetical protein WH82_16570 [Parageobacillus thermoglucosidasius]OUM92897.1 MAG: hypothetical protein BAA00_08605 [Parageobacillus thermoglucosidasius]
MLSPLLVPFTHTVCGKRKNGQYKPRGIHSAEYIGEAGNHVFVFSGEFMLLFAPFLEVNLESKKNGYLCFR